MHHPLADIPEIAWLESGRSLIRVPDEQDVPFTPRVRAIVDSQEFRRLSGISQLGLTSLVYPGATHTRFEHALGVFHNALRYLWQLGRDRRFSATVSPQTAECLMVAALLHDLGHWPFCHPIEDLELAGHQPHEIFAAEFLGDDSELADVLQSEWNLRPQQVLEVLAGQPRDAETKLVQSILSGPIDIDKMDYLNRDSLHCGVPYGRNFDRRRLIGSLLVNEAGDGLAISSKGKTAAELMVFARYVMFSEVYWHHAVRSATSMFARAYFELHARLPTGRLFRMTEQEMIAELRRAAVGSSVERLVDGVFGPRRRLYKRMAEFSFYQDEDLYGRMRGSPFARRVDCAEALAEELSRRSGAAVEEADCLIDTPPIHREVEFNVQIYFEKEDCYRPLKMVSPVVESLARTQFDDYVKKVRVFLAPQLADRINEDTFQAALHAAVDRVYGESTS